ncbi:glycosyltransferase family 4 protein [Patescibacteria group bacterium]|nr:glycosyltransferase family 4 protein [Patescibacteria group bacterium]
MKKIIFYTDTPQSGGAELQMFLLAKFLNKDKYKPILVCGNSPELNTWCEKFQKEDIPVIRIETASKHSTKHYTTLKQIIKEEKPDLLHAHIWNPASCRYAYLAAKHTHTPMIITEHDPFALPLLKNLIKKYLIKPLQKIITVSKNNANLLRKLYPAHSQKIEVIHNGIDTNWWQSQLLRFTEEDRKEIKTQLFHAKENTLIVTTIAELHERKGLKYLIQAIPSVVEKYPNTKFVIIGEGKERANLEKLVSKLKMEAHVSLIGRQSEIPKLLKASNIFVLPSLREAFGLVNAEAMISPLPVVASDVGGISEIVKNGETGILVEPKDSKGLTRGINQLIASPKLREKMAIAGFERVQKHFSADAMAKEYEKVYEEIFS